jgi:hypothetical protein
MIPIPVLVSLLGETLLSREISQHISGQPMKRLESREATAAHMYLALYY